MSGPRIVVVGDALLDRDVTGEVRRLCPDAPVPVLEEAVSAERPGGAGLAALLGRRLRATVTLITALGDDAAGLRLGRLLAGAGVEVVAAPLIGCTPEKIRLRAGGQSLLRVDRASNNSAVGALPPLAVPALGDAGAVLVSDYGRGMAAHPELVAVLGRIHRPRLWDPHPRGPSPVPGCTLVTPNRAELLAAFGTGPPGTARAASAPPGADGAGPGHDAVAAAARRARRAWAAGAVAVTTGAEGALLVSGDEPPLVVPATPASGDSCGAGDCFAVAATLALSEGAVISEAVIDAVGASASFVAAGGAAGLPGPSAAGTPARTPPPAGAGEPGGDAVALAAEVRARGGTVVVAGGCFDLLHAGHVALLDAARKLGDCLIVALNSDTSVRRLKGPGRPVVPAADRAAVLAALASVDAVTVFDEESPLGVLGKLRPHVFAKGGDYGGRRLPEEAVLAGWGGRVAILPYVSGRSTSALVRRAGSGAL